MLRKVKELENAMAAKDRAGPPSKNVQHRSGGGRGWLEIGNQAAIVCHR